MIATLGSLDAVDGECDEVISVEITKDDSIDDGWETDGCDKARSVEIDDGRSKASPTSKMP